MSDLTKCSKFGFKCFWAIAQAPKIFPVTKLFILCKVIIHNFYATETEIWAGFGPVGSTWAAYEQLLRAIFHVFIGKKKIIIFLKIL